MRKSHHLLPIFFLATGSMVYAQVSFIDHSQTLGAMPDSISVTGLSLADYDRDGDLDILYQGFTGFVSRRLYRNKLNESGELGFELAVGPTAENKEGERVFLDINSLLEPGDHWITW